MSRDNPFHSQRNLMRLTVGGDESVGARPSQPRSCPTVLIRTERNLSSSK